MAEECPTSEVVRTKEEVAPMECETSEPKCIKADDIALDKGALPIPVSGATTAAASTPDSESAMNPEDARRKEEALAQQVSGATSAAASASASDSECAMSSGDSDVKAEALKLSASGVTSAAVSEGVKSPDDTVAKEVAADPSGLLEPSVPAPVTKSTTDDPEYLSAKQVAEVMDEHEKAKVGILKGVKDAVKAKAKSFLKKLSPKKPEKAALAASAQDAESVEASETVKKPIKPKLRKSASRGSLELNSVASDEMTLNTNLTPSSSGVFPPDQESIGTGDTATHASRLPSLGSPEHKAQESSGDRDDEAMDDGNVEESS